MVRVQICEKPLSVVITFIYNGALYYPHASLTLSAEERDIGKTRIYAFKKIACEYKNTQIILSI